MSGWLWMLRRFGLRRTWRYWRLGQREGWMTQEQSDAFFNEYLRAQGVRDEAEVLADLAQEKADRLLKDLP